MILDGSNVSSTGDNTVHSAAADANEQYVFVVYNLGDRSGAIKAQITALTSAGQPPIQKEFMDLNIVLY